MTLPTLKKDYYPSYPRIHKPQGLENTPINMFKMNDKNSIYFIMDNWLELQINENEKELKLNYSKPNLINLIYGKRLEYFENIVRLDCFIPNLLKKYKNEIDKDKLMKIRIIITVNGIKSFQVEKMGDKFDKYNKYGFQIIAPSKFKMIPEIVLGNKKIENGY